MAVTGFIPNKYTRIGTESIDPPLPINPKIRPTIKRKGSILSGIALMQDYEIIVERNSHNIIREFNNYVWHERRQKPIDKYNHFVDAIRYSLQYLVQGVNSGKYVIR